jgi:hypothetical protein
MKPMKPLIELSTEHYDALLKGAAENFALYSRLTNAVKTQKTIAILCELDEAEMLLYMAKTFCPDAIPEIEKAIRSAQFRG